MSERATVFAKEYGFSAAKDCGFQYKDKSVFVAYYDEVLYTGLPQFILVSKKTVEFAMPEENEHILALIRYART